MTSLFVTNQCCPRYNHGSNRRSADRRSVEPSSSWCNKMQLELGSNLRSPVNVVQLNRDLIVVGATGP